jgi:hypothetical protein
MAYGLGWQSIKPIGSHRRKHRKWTKVAKHRAERRRVARNIDCAPGYRKYYGVND